MAIYVLFSIPTYLESVEEIPGVIIYKHANFQGMNKFIPIGQNYNSLRSIKWNDKISSIKLIRNGIVKIYEHDNFNGNTITIKDHVADMGVLLQGAKINWNDQVSSLKVEDRNAGNNSIQPNIYGNTFCIFYDNIMKTGISYKANLGEYSIVQQDWKGRINSIWVKPGYKLVIYEKENFQGKQLTLFGRLPEGTSYNLKDYRFDKITSSYKITPDLFINKPIRPIKEKREIR